MKYKIKKLVRKDGTPYIFLDRHNHKHGPWHIAVRTDQGRDFGYLWEDGSISGSCFDDSDNVRGWFNTREAARKAVRIRKALDRQQTVS